MTTMNEAEKKLEEMLKAAGKSAQNVRMTAAEKTARKADLMHFMEKAIHLPASRKNPAERSSSVWESLWRRINPVYIATPLIIASLGAGVVYGAENSLPGDFLYPVKTSVIEKMQSSLAVNRKDKAALHAKFAIKRLEEIEEVSKKRVLTDEQIQQMNAHFDENQKELDDDLKDLKNAHEDDAATELSTNFSTKLDQHRKIFNVIKMHEVREQIKLEKQKMLEEIKIEQESKINDASKNEDAQSTEGQTQIGQPQLVPDVPDTISHPLVRSVIKKRAPVFLPVIKPIIKPIIRNPLPGFPVQTHEGRI